MSELETRICKSCNDELPLSNFYFRKESGSYRPACKKCKRVTTKEEIIKRVNSETKVCKHCNIEKPISHYNKAGGGKWAQPYCKPCDTIRKAKHTQNNIDKVKEKARQNYLKRRKLVPAHIKEQNSKIRIENFKKAR